MRPVMPRRPLGGCGRAPGFSCCLSAAAVRLVGVLLPPGIPLPSAYQSTGPGPCWTMTGYPRSARVSYGRFGCLLYPGTMVLTRPAKSIRPPLPLPSGRSCARFPHPIHPGSSSRGVVGGSLSFTRPAFPSPVAPGWNGRPRAFLLASHPAAGVCGARRSGDRLRALAWSTAVDRVDPPLSRFTHTVRHRVATLRTWPEPVTARSPLACGRISRLARRLPMTSALTCVDVPRPGGNEPVGAYAVQQDDYDVRRSAESPLPALRSRPEPLDGPVPKIAPPQLL